MQRIPTYFLRAAVIVLGTAVLAICVLALPAIWRAVPGEYPADVSYAFYMILLALYAAAVPFFLALHQAIKLLNYIDKGKAFSKLSVKALQSITYCALAISAVFALSLPFFYVWAQADDAPGLVVVAMFLTMAPFTIGVFSGVLGRLFGDAVRIKSENDLTV